MTRYGTYIALGLVGGAAAVITAGLGYAIHDWQTSIRKTRSTR